MAGRGAMLPAAILAVALAVPGLAVMAVGWWLDHQDGRWRVSEQTPEEELGAAVDRWAQATEAVVAAGEEVQAERAAAEAAERPTVPEGEVELG